MKIIRFLCHIIAFVLSISVYAQTDTVDLQGKLERMATVESLPSTNGLMLTLPQQGLFLADNNTLYSLDEEQCSLEKMRILLNVPIEQLFVNNGHFIVKSGAFVIEMGNDKSKTLLEFEDDDFLIFNGNDGHFYVMLPENEDEWGVYCYNLESSQLTCLVRLEEPVYELFDVDTVCILLTTNRIYSIVKDNLYLLAEVEDEIIDATVTPAGIVFCTTDNLYIWNVKDDVQLVGQLQIHSLYSDGDILYLLMQNGDILKALL